MLLSLLKLQSSKLSNKLKVKFLAQISFQIGNLSFMPPKSDYTPKYLTQWLFNITQNADLVGITTEGNKVKQAVFRHR